MCDIFQFRLDKIMGVEGVWILQRRLYEGTETCRMGLHMCVFAPLCQREKKNKNHCLETYVNDMWLLEKS
jgi:hypothetical protein